jgi:hypothetical protein
MSLGSDDGMILTGKNRRTRRKTCPSATLSTTNPTWVDSGANQGLRGERAATNYLSHNTAQESYLLISELNVFHRVTHLTSGFNPCENKTLMMWQLSQRLKKGAPSSPPNEAVSYTPTKLNPTPIRPLPRHHRQRHFPYPSVGSL